MDQGPPDAKRIRVASWSSSTPQGPSLPPPHHTPTQLAPPPPPSPHHHHHQGPTSYQPYPPRSTDHPPPQPLVPVHGHAQQHRPDVDRRHPDQEPLSAMQDPYRHQPPSPATHGHYSQYPPRDSHIKREDDARRPSSTGHAPESIPAPPHPISTSHPPASVPPAAYGDSQSRHMSFDSGGLPLTPGGYRTPTGYAAPTPAAHQSSYEHSNYPSGEPFYSVYPSTIPAKKKNTRASQACDQCRQLKAKCDETKPCKTCRDKGSECRYRDPVPKATDKAQADILEGITMMQQTLSNLTDEFGNMNRRLNKMEKIVTNSPAAAPPLNAAPIITREEYHASVDASSPPPAENGMAGEYFVNDHSRGVVSSTEQIPMRMMAEDELEAEPGPPVPPGEPAIPINHTTLAGLLLDWPGIKELTKHHLERERVRFIGEFPISQEQNRGHLIVYGRGEDSHLSRHAREVLDHGSLDMGDDSSDMASPSPAADYGQLGGSPSDQVEYRGGVLASDGNPDFSESKVWAYVTSFKENILNMHPIIQPKVLDYWVRHFLDSLPTPQSRPAKPQPSKPTFAFGTAAAPTAPPEITGAKRKRSPGPDGSDGPQTPAPGRPGKPKRSIHSALVLTVLALGKVCLHRTSIPDVVPYADPLPQGSPVARNGVPSSPSQGSPPGFSSLSNSSGLPSPKEQDRGPQSRRSSIPATGGLRSGFHLKKNYDVIPGLEYFAFATDILGNHAGAYNNMKNVYANIFAGLYHGQLGRPLESFAFIHQASHKLQVIMRPSLDKMRKIKRNAEFIQDTKYNQLALTFWTCLQLESDLIAELQLPPSGLLSYEDDMPHPNMSLLEGFDQRVLDSYPGQLYLRTHLNSIHRMFYAPEDPIKVEQDMLNRDRHGKINDKFKNVVLVADAVSSMNWVAPSFAFKENDPPAEDILGARLRAKYWGAQVITYRPFIRQILLWSDSMKNHPSSPNLAATSEFRQDIIAPVIHPNTRSPSEIDRQVIELAEKGIKALIESTRAFHGLGSDRPIITNVFGTAHAQWGNLLVLSAAFKDPVLHSIVDEELLRTLFQRTIQFLQQSATATSSLKIDLHILEGLHRDLFNTVDVRATSSFSSNASLQTPKMPMAAPPSAGPAAGSDPNLATPNPQHGLMGFQSRN